MSNKQFVVTVNYKSEWNDWDVVSHDVLVANSLEDLESQLEILIKILKRRIAGKEK